MNCFATYALVGLNWGYRRSDYPFYAVGICLAVALGAAVAAGIYNCVSPLGRDFVPEFDESEAAEEASSMVEKGELPSSQPQMQTPTLLHLLKKHRLLERRTTFASREGDVVEDP